ncbi:MAG: hypothetical protein HYR64_04700 [Fimbriimonas ginsengisoli]|uniref:Uncharacterized protein n=1 Tax=Fimbriimonas ginsengisoli TaxID=1005039 RepID=A0A931PVL4_FIMGI|nr:hypothetical protein [Fimbriimonas ginsengisoli]MBI3744672.1 hypothetical protein [Chloroflexota bacterium]
MVMKEISGAIHGGETFDRIETTGEGLGVYRKAVNADVLDAWYEPSPNVLAALQEHLAWVCRSSPRPALAA